MLKHNYSLTQLGPLLALLFVVLPAATLAQNNPPVEERYAGFFEHYEDEGSWWSRALQTIAEGVGLRETDVGRSFALIAGVSRYPNMGILDQNLEPAREDLRLLRDYLKNYEFFDEIVVLELRGGKVIRQSGVADNLTALGQLGVLPGQGS